MNAIALCLLAVFPPALTTEEAEGMSFGIDKYAVRMNLRLARDNPGTWRELVHANNDAATCQRWESEVAWRLRCWDKLDDVVYCQLTPQSKRQSLVELRALLGEEAWAARRMPAAIASYKVPSPWK